MHELDHPHVDFFSGLPEPVNAPAANEVDRRAQELLDEWLAHYFSGVEFQSLAADGSTFGKTYERAEIHFDTYSPGDNAVLPVIHTILADRRDGPGQSVGNGLQFHTGTWTWNTFVRVHPQQPARPADGGDLERSARAKAEQLCRRIADQFRDLVSGPDARDLVLKGIGNPAVLNGPRVIPGGAWFIRQIVWSATVSFHVPLP